MGWSCTANVGRQASPKSVIERTVATKIWPQTAMINNINLAPASDEAIATADGRR